MALREFPKRILCGDDWQTAMLLEKTATAAHQGSGTVELTIVVGRDGDVIEVRPMSDSAEWIGPAINTVKQWRFRPTMVNGIPVEVQTTVHVPV